MSKGDGFALAVVEDLQRERRELRAEVERLRAERDALRKASAWVLEADGGWDITAGAFRRDVDPARKAGEERG